MEKNVELIDYTYDWRGRHRAIFSFHSSRIGRVVGILARHGEVPEWSNGAHC